MLSMVAVACGGAAGDEKPKPRPPAKIGDGRPKETQCKPDREPGSARPGVKGACKSDEDCTAGKNGRCSSIGERVLENGCTYDACMKDADCTTGGPCECNSYRGNYCVTGNCRVDADCGSGGACGRSNSMACRGRREPTYYCRTPKDSCTSDSDCKPNSMCIYSSQVGHWTCQEPPECPVG